MSQKSLGSVNSRYGGAVRDEGVILLKINMMSCIRIIQWKNKKEVEKIRELIWDTTAHQTQQENTPRWTRNSQTRVSSVFLLYKVGEDDLDLTWQLWWRPWEEPRGPPGWRHSGSLAHPGSPPCSCLRPLREADKPVVKPCETFLHLESPRMFQTDTIYAFRGLEFMSCLDWSSEMGSFCQLSYKV